MEAGQTDAGRAWTCGRWARHRAFHEAPASELSSGPASTDALKGRIYRQQSYPWDPKQRRGCIAGGVHISACGSARLGAQPTNLGGRPLPLSGLRHGTELAIGNSGHDVLRLASVGSCTTATDFAPVLASARCTEWRVLLVFGRQRPKCLAAASPLIWPPAGARGSGLSLPT
jgi:hypothetical protein